MDKKKVIELIKKAETFLHNSKKEGLDYLYDLLTDIEYEVLKPDWISVEDELPPIGDVVRVRSKQTPNDLMIACRTDESTMKTVYPLNKFYSQDITHWHKIDKLEV